MSWFNKDKVEKELPVLEEARLYLLGEVNREIERKKASMNYHAEQIKYHMDKLEESSLEKKTLLEKQHKLIEAANEAHS